MSNESNDLGAFLAGFVIGGLVGAAAALILAPQSGEDTRSMLASQGTGLREAGAERLHTYRDVAGTYVSDARERARTAADQVQEQARIVLDEGKSRLGRMQEGNGGGASTDMPPAGTEDAAA